MSSSDESLDRVDSIFRIGDLLMTRGLSHEPLTLFRKGNDGRRGAVAGAVDEHLGLVPFHNRNNGVGRPQVNADNP